MKFFLLGGGVRTGTTLMADWLGKNWRDAFTTKESAILRYADWQLSSARFCSRLTEFRSLFIEETRRTVERLYREIGWDGEQPVFDKETFVFSDLAYTLEHLRLILEPDLTLVWMVREPIAVINSMRNRTWGDVRGSVLNPKQRLNYWSQEDIHDFMSPFSYRLSERENLVGDLAAHQGHQGQWSLEKCCLHFQNSTLAADLLPSDQVLVVNYDRLGDIDYRQFVQTWIEERAGTKFAQELPFSPRQRHELMTPSERSQVDAMLGAETWTRYHALVDRAQQQFEQSLKTSIVPSFV